MLFVSMLTFAPYQLHEGSTLPTSSLATTNGKPGWPYQRHEGTLPTSSLATTNGKPESPPPPQKRPPPALKDNHSCPTSPVIRAEESGDD